MKNKIYVIIIVVLAISSLTFWAQKRSLYFSQKYERAVPHIELSSAMMFYGVDSYNGKILTSSNSGNIAVGSITGFVKFPKVEDQPKGAWQYYIIETTNNYGEDGKQIFTLEEVIKMPAVAPRYFDKQILIVTNNNPQAVTLEDENGNTYRINKLNDEVTIIDAGGDIATLITSDSKYRDFMLSFLK